MTNKLRHQILGFCTLICLGIAIGLYCSGNAGLQHSGESTLRLTILLFVLWLAWDDLLSFPRWFYIFAPIAVLAVFVFRQPGVILIVIFVAFWLIVKFLKFITQPLTPQQRRGKR